MQVFRRWGFAGLTLVLAAGWSYREVAFARARQVKSATINLDQLQMAEFTDKGEPVGKNGVYIAGDTPASTKFMTGRFMLHLASRPTLLTLIPKKKS